MFINIHTSVGYYYYLLHKFMVLTRCEIFAYIAGLCFIISLLPPTPNKHNLFFHYLKYCI